MSEIIEKSIKAFFVDGSKRNLADIILENKISGKSCAVASFGFGVKQVRRLISSFDKVLLVADESHSKLNPKAYEEILKIERNVKNFTFKPVITHAKVVIIDDEVLIFTSANLSVNSRIESYLICGIDEVDGVDKIYDLMCDPKTLFKTDDKDDDLDISFDLDDLNTIEL